MYMSQNNNTKRLTVDKVKTENSYQNNLSPAEIKEKLEEYKKVEDITKIALNSHLRYFIVNEKTKEKQFRLGGFLTKIDSEKGYLVLSNGKLSWSVQLKNSIFFQKMTFKELKEELVDEIKKIFNKEIKNLREENKKLKETLKEIKIQAKNDKNSGEKKSKKSSKKT